MSCKYCEHCKDIEKQKDYKKRKSYVENSRINMYIPQHSSNGMTIEEAEEYLSQTHGHDYWYRLSFDIPIDKDLYNKWKELK